MSNAIEGIVKSYATKDFTPDQWLELGLACLDQAGVSLRRQTSIECLAIDDITAVTMSDAQELNEHLRRKAK